MIRLERPLAKTGVIEMVYVYDSYTDVIHSQVDFPLEIPMFESAWVAAVGRNTSDITLHLKLSAKLIDPDGVERGYTFVSRNVLPGRLMGTPWSNEVKLDKEGTWKIIVRLEEV